MVKVTRPLLVTPLWDFPAEAGRDYRLGLVEALAEHGVDATLVGPILPGASEAATHDRVIGLAAGRRRPNHSPRLAREIRDHLAGTARRTQADLVHYLDLRLAGLGGVPGLPATGWLGDTLGSLAPLLPAPRSGPGWFWRWRDARRCRAMQVAALAHLAGVAVPTEEVGKAAARSQGRGMPLTHRLGPLEQDPVGHAAGLLRLWEELPY